MNATTSQSSSSIPGLTDRAVAYLRQHLWRERGTEPKETLEAGSVPTKENLVVFARRIQTISSEGRQSAGLFGKSTDSTSVVRVSTTAKSRKPAVGTAEIARPRFANLTAKSANRIVIIR